MRTRLLDAAQRLVQTRGHNGFSFRDLSRQVGIRTASVHYYFPTKTDLAVAIVRRYREALAEAMGEIAVRENTLSERLDATVRLYTVTLDTDSRICVCAALAGEYLSLPRPVQSELKRLITEGERWIERFMTQGRVRGEIPEDSDPHALARLWYAALQGGLLVSRAASSAILNDAAAALKKMTLAQGINNVRF